MLNTTWIVVADSGQAKIFRTIKARLFNGKANGSDLTLVSEYNHPESRKRDQDLVADKYGNFGNSSFTEETDPKRHENDIFAQQLAKALYHGHSENNYHDLILIAPPAFMGMIHKHLSNEVKKLISKEIEKDYTRSNEKELVSQLQVYL